MACWWRRAGCPPGAARGAMGTTGQRHGGAAGTASRHHTSTHGQSLLCKGGAAPGVSSACPGGFFSPTGEGAPHLPSPTCAQVAAPCRGAPPCSGPAGGSYRAPPPKVVLCSQFSRFFSKTVTPSGTAQVCCDAGASPRQNAPSASPPGHEDPAPTHHHHPHSCTRGSLPSPEPREPLAEDEDEHPGSATGCLGTLGVPASLLQRTSQGVPTGSPLPKAPGCPTLPPRLPAFRARASDGARPRRS